jgi:hypothetical protein
MGICFKAMHKSIMDPRVPYPTKLVNQNLIHPQISGEARRRPLEVTSRTIPIFSQHLGCCFHENDEADLNFIPAR